MGTLPDRRLRAALLAVAIAAFSSGLHPEPPLGPRSGAAPELARSTASVEAVGAHDCLACRAQRSLLSAPAPTALAAPRRLVLSLVHRAPFFLRSRSSSPRDGRAPPAIA